MKTTGLWTILLLAPGVWGTPASDAADRYYQAIRNHDVTALRSLIKSGDVNTRDKRDATPLMYASAVGASEALRLLIEAGADVNAKNAFDATALMWCAGDTYKVKMLVSKGADVNARSKQGRTPLLIAAASNDSYDVVKFLMDSGADVSARDSMGQTALLLATSANDTATIKLLLEKNLDVNAVNRRLTPLMYAAMNGNAEIVRTLITRGADVNAVSKPTGEKPVKNGMIALGSFTPLILSAVYSGSDVVKALLDAGANVNAKDVRGMTPADDRRRHRTTPTCPPSVCSWPRAPTRRFSPRPASPRLTGPGSSPTPPSTPRSASPALASINRRSRCSQRIANRSPRASRQLEASPCCSAPVGRSSKTAAADPATPRT